MKAQEHRLTIDFEARYYQLGTLDENTRNLWFVLHGQGHLAKIFIKKFEVVGNKTTCIIAPEGLFRYYLNGFYGKVGATWMTKEDRLTDIRNYLKYLNHVYKKVINGKDMSDVKVTLFGFSQGAATVSRWALEKEITFDRLILWGGIIPFDMDFETGRQKLDNVEIYTVIGDEDPFVDDNKISEQEDYEKKLGILPEKIVFNGKHEILPEVLKQFS